MTAAAYTPGPWIAYKRPEPIGYAEYEIHYGAIGECVAEVVHGAGNAHLLAAAPNLLAALQLAVRQNSCDMVLTGEEIRQCKAAITKATGGVA